jgi:hypothetical protein
MGWLNNRVGELTEENTRLRQDLARAKTGARRSVAAPTTASVYRRARRVVGAPLRRALQGGRG